VREIRIGLCGTSWDYKQSLVPKIIETIAGKISWVSPKKADLVIIGPFECYLSKQKRNLTPKILRKHDEKETYLDNIKGIKLFHTNENIRSDKVKVDFSISFDHTPNNPNNLRFPYWMEFIDWSKEGIVGQENPRFGRLINQEELLRPLDTSHRKRELRAAFFTSHLNEPRREIYYLLNKLIPIDGYGAFFNDRIKSHSDSGIKKNEILENYIFNLCPENSMFPGYNTEKIPEAFASGCIPITWTVPGHNKDFNQGAYINLALGSDLEFFKKNFNNRNELYSRFYDQSLLLNRIDLNKLFDFLMRVIKAASS